MALADPANRLWEQVYRLLTARTYEAEMFQRAAQKLTLDKVCVLSVLFDRSSVISQQVVLTTLEAEGKKGGRKASSNGGQSLLATAELIRSRVCCDRRIDAF